MNATATTTRIERLEVQLSRVSRRQVDLSWLSYEGLPKQMVDRLKYTRTRLYRLQQLLEAAIELEEQKTC